MSLKNIVFSGFKDKKIYSKLLRDKYNICETIDENTKYLIIKDIDDIDLIESYTKCSPKIKLAIQYQIPIMSEKKLEELLKCEFS